MNPQFKICPAPASLVRPPLTALGLVIALAIPGAAQVIGIQKISEVEGGFTGFSGDQEYLPSDIAALGDVDGDGVGDVALGHNYSSFSGSYRGGVWILLMNADGTVKSTNHIAEGVGGFSGTLSDGDQFGFSVAGPGDLDGDGICDLVAGAPFDDDGGTDRGAVYVMTLSAQGTVTSTRKISSSTDLSGVLRDHDNFGSSLAGIGNFDNTSAPDIVVGASGDIDGSPTLNSRGAIYTLFLDPSGRVNSFRKISDTAGNFTGPLSDGNRFGISVANIGDIDGNGSTDLFVGAPGDDDGGASRGAGWVLLLTPSATVLTNQKISAQAGGLSGPPNDLAQFGTSACSLGDRDADGLTEIAVGAISADDGTIANCGLVYILELDSFGVVVDQEEIGPASGGGPAQVTGSDFFGLALAAPGDLDGDGRIDLVVGAGGDDDGGVNHGAAYVLFLDGCVDAASLTYRNDAGAQNPFLYRTVAPRIGQTWTATVDLTGSGFGGTAVVGYSSALELATAFGVLLVNIADPSGELLALPTHFGGPVLMLSAFIPSDPALCGFSFSTQAVAILPGAQMLNAADLVIGF